MNALTRVVMATAIVGSATGSVASARQVATPAAQAAPAAPAAEAPAKAFSQEELDQMLAPLALYPDALLTQILMASTYPLEIVQADRWTKAHKTLKGDALATELEKQEWDPSVRSLVNFPEVLSSLSEKLDWTVKIGDAFLADEKRVLDSVQALRAKAKDAGNLKTTEQQNVTVKQEGATQTIVIESSKPDVVYVPAYDSTVVYGGWPYPTYPPPPPYYAPPYYQPGAALVGFGVGLACGAAWGYAWGNCNWGGGDVNINVNQNNNFNNKINRNQYQNNMNRAGGAGGQWKHDPAHRQGAAYRDSATAQRFEGNNAARQNASRDQFRGRAEQGRQDINRGAAQEFRGEGAQGRGAAGANTREAGGANRAGATSREAGGASRGGAGATSRQSGAGSRGSAGASRGSGGFEGMGGGGASARSSSQRGHASRGGGGGGSRGGRGGGGGRRG